MANDITKYVTIDNIVALLKKLKKSDFFVADANYVGGFKTGFVETGARKQVQIDESQRAYVELWPDDQNKGDVGESNRPVYFENAIPKAITIPSDTGTEDRPIVVVDVQTHKLYKNNSVKANYMTETITAPGGLKGPLANNAGKLNIGKDTTNEVQPVYFKDGVPTAPKSKVGSGAASDAGAQAIYMNSGKLVPIQKTIGSATKPIYMQNGIFTACNDIVYTSNIQDKTMEMPDTVGGIQAGTTVQTLNGNTFSQLFDDLLFPTKNDVSVSDNSLKVTGLSVTPNTTPVYVGSSLSKINAEGTFSRGTWSKYNDGKNAAGPESGRTYTLKDPSNTSIKTGANKTAFNGSIASTDKFTSPGNYKYTVTVNYSATQNADIPVNNKGQKMDGTVSNVPNICLSSSSVSQSVTINATYPWYAPTGSMGTFAEQKKLTWGTSISTGEFTLPAQADNAAIGNRQGFKIPYPSGRSTTVSIQVWIPAPTNAWVASTEFTYENTTLNGINYRHYYLNSGSAVGSRKFKITF